MPSKAEKLKQGARKTGRGLFKDMERLNSAVEEEELENTVTSDIDNESKTTEEVNENNGHDTVREQAEVHAAMASTPTVSREEPTVFTDDDSKSRRPVEEPQVGPAVVKAEESVVLQEILKGVTETVEEKNTVREDKTEPVLEESRNSNIITDDEIGNIEEISVINENIKREVNKVENAAAKPARKQNSRYEKDKFLLLDIRGYRDYIEHIAKAANMSATKYIRSLIEQDMEKNKDIYIAHKKLEEMLRNKAGS